METQQLQNCAFSQLTEHHQGFVHVCNGNAVTDRRVNFGSSSVSCFSRHDLLVFVYSAFTTQVKKKGQDFILQPEDRMSDWLTQVIDTSVAILNPQLASLSLVVL